MIVLDALVVSTCHSLEHAGPAGPPANGDVERLAKRLQQGKQGPHAVPRQIFSGRDAFLITLLSIGLFLRGLLASGRDCLGTKRPSGHASNELAWKETGQ